MKIKINGNVVTFVSSINFDELTKATAQTPVFIKNELGKKIFGVDTAIVGNINESGITFSFANADGNACFNVCFDPEMTTTQIKEDVLDEFGSTIMKFNDYEDAIKQILQARVEARDAIASHIEIG